MIQNDSRKFRELRFSVDPERIYSLPDLIDLAESHNPETRVAWEGTRAQLAALGVVRSELYPTLAAIASSDESVGELLWYAFLPAGATDVWSSAGPQLHGLRFRRAQR